MTLVMEEMDETVDKDPARRDVSIPAMREFVAGIRHPLHRALVVALLKTGMRVGELCNLDLRDLAIDDEEVRETFALGTRPALADRTRCTSHRRRWAGEELNGEARTASNKRKRATVIPIDDELMGTLKRWLAVRPDGPSSADPLFVGTAEGWGERLDPQAVRHVVERYAREAGVVPYGWRCRRERHAPLLPALLHDASPGPDGRSRRRQVPTR